MKDILRFLFCAMDRVVLCICYGIVRKIAVASHMAWYGHDASSSADVLWWSLIGSSSIFEQNDQHPLNSYHIQNLFSLEK